MNNIEINDKIENLIQENEELKEKYKRLSIEAQATAFDDMNKDTEGLLRVLLKQGEITLDEKGYYQRKDFDWEENLTKMGLMKKREKNFYIPDDSLDEYIKQLENQLKEYNEMKEIFKKYYVMGNETMYDGCCKMQDEIDELKKENKELNKKRKDGTLSDGYHTYNDLYYQRCVLFATICNLNKDISWKSKKHSDGKKCFDSDNWFIVGIDTPEGSYTYHYEMKYWDMFNVKELKVGKIWDGHTEKDVTRLLTLEEGE